MNYVIKCIIKGICIAAVITLAIFGFGYITMQLWNWLMPDIFGLKEITYWQALGLLVLGKILFSSFGGKGGRGKCGNHKDWGGNRGGMWKKRWEEKMAKMSPEEREKFKKGWGNCGWNDSSCEEEKPSDSKIQ